jgi:hypothetical protein
MMSTIKALEEVLLIFLRDSPALVMYCYKHLVALPLLAARYLYFDLFISRAVFQGVRDQLCKTCSMRSLSAETTSSSSGVSSTIRPCCVNFVRAAIASYKTSSCDILAAFQVIESISLLPQTSLPTTHGHEQEPRKGRADIVHAGCMGGAPQSTSLLPHAAHAQYGPYDGRDPPVHLYYMAQSRR